MADDLLFGRMVTEDYTEKATKKTTDMKTTAKQELALDYLMDLFQNADNTEDFLLQFWLYWVQSVTLTQREFQQIASNSAVNIWFMEFIGKEEKEFRVLASRYSTIEGEAIDKLYIDCVVKVMSRFPQALLQDAKRRTEKPVVSKFMGIKVEISTLNQN